MTANPNRYYGAASSSVTVIALGDSILIRFTTRDPRSLSTDVYPAALNVMSAVSLSSASVIKSFSLLVSVTSKSDNAISYSPLLIFNKAHSGAIVSSECLI